MRHRTLTAAAIGVCLLGLAEGASGGIGRILAVRHASTILTAIPGLEAADISAGDGSLSIRDLDYQGASGVRLHVGRLTLPNRTPSLLRLVSAAEAEPAGIVANDVSIKIGHTLITIPRIEAQGTYLTADRLKALLDPATDLSAIDRVKGITAASLVAPVVTVTELPPGVGTTRPPTLGDGGKTTFEDVALTDVVAGRIGVASVRKMTAFKSSAADAPAAVTAGPLTVTGLDLPLGVRIATTGRTDASEAPGGIYGSLSIRDILIAPDETATIRIGAIAADGFRGRPLLRRPADVVALIEKPGSSQTPDNTRALTEIAIDAAKGFSLDHLEWDDIAVSGTSKGPFSIKLGRISIDGMTPTQIGTWALANLAVVSGEGSYSLERMALHAPDERQLVDILVHEYASSGFAMDRTKLMGGVPQDGSLSMLGLHLEIPSEGGPPGNSPDGHRNLVDIPVVSFASDTDPTTTIATTTAHMRGTYVLPPLADNPGLSALVRSRFKALDARADYRMIFDPKGREFRLDPLTIEAEQLGRLSISGDVGNVPFDLLARGRPASDADTAIGQVTFKSLSLDFRNDGVVEMALPVLAESANTSVPMLKVAAKTQSDLFIGQTLGATPVAQRLQAAIDAFIDNPKNLHIAVTAPAGLTGAEIQASPDPKSLLDRVGIEAAANR